MEATKTFANITKADLDEVELKPVGNNNFENIVFYYTFKAPTKDNQRELVKNASVYGTYQGTMTDKVYGKTTHKIRTTDGLVGVNGSGRLNQLMSNVPIGAIVKVTYLGKQKIEKGQWAGKQAHGFTVAASAQKTA